METKTKKTYRLSGRCIEIIREYADKNEIPEAAAVERLVIQAIDNELCKKDEALIERIFDTFESRYSEYFTVIKLSSRAAECSGKILIEAVNALLLENDCKTEYLSSVCKAPVIRKAETEIKNQMNALRQRKLGG